jgi:hypothetical protein
VVQIWPGQSVTCLHTNSPGHIGTTLYHDILREEGLILFQKNLLLLPIPHLARQNTTSYRLNLLFILSLERLGSEEIRHTFFVMQCKHWCKEPSTILEYCCRFRADFVTTTWSWHVQFFCYSSLRPTCLRNVSFIMAQIINTHTKLMLPTLQWDPFNWSIFTVCMHLV